MFAQNTALTTNSCWNPLRTSRRTWIWWPPAYMPIASLGPVVRVTGMIEGNLGCMVRGSLLPKCKWIIFCVVKWIKLELSEYFGWNTLPETKIAPETPGLEDYVSFWEGLLAGTTLIFREWNTSPMKYLLNSSEHVHVAAFFVWGGHANTANT